MIAAQLTAPTLDKDVSMVFCCIYISQPHDCVLAHS